MCPKAPLAVLVQIGAKWEMSAEWANSGKEELPEIVWRHVRCLDPGFETFLAAPSPLAMWVRRQAHETAMHRVDAESPGNTITNFDPAFAADGVDELLSCFITRPGCGPKVSSPCSIHVHTTDTDDDWHLQIGLENVVTSRLSSPADCAISGAAGDLYLLLWNRRSDAGISVDGDRNLLALWREGVQIRWS
jgi:uncharacterized protein (TIGR03083 family)